MRLRIDLRQLECFVAVTEEGSFRAAADRLHMSQPPLTAAGRTFLTGARKTLLQANRAVEAARRAARSAPPCLRVGYTTVFDPEVIPVLQPAFQKNVFDRVAAVQRAC